MEIVITVLFELKSLLISMARLNMDMDESLRDQLRPWIDARVEGPHFRGRGTVVKRSTILGWRLLDDSRSPQLHRSIEFFLERLSM